MTEDEAKTKWCPQARLSNAPEGSWNRSGPYPSDALCIGSACMAWRWDLSGSGVEMTFNEGRVSFKVPDGSEPQGFCGLAGKP